MLLCQRYIYLKTISNDIILILIYLLIILDTFIVLKQYYEAE